LHVMGNMVIENGNLGIGITNPKSTLDLSGSMGFSVENITGDITASNNTMIFADTSSDNITVTLPYAGNVMGRIYTVKKTSALNSLWVVGGGNYIDNFVVLELSASSTTDRPSVTLESSGTQWYIMGGSGNTEEIGSGNLIAWWKFDETSGTAAADSSAFDNSLALQNGLDFSSDSVAGKIGTALDFDGTDDYAIVGSANLQPAQITVMHWMKPNSPAAWGRTVSHPYDTTQTDPFQSYGIMRNDTNGYTLYSITDATSEDLIVTNSSDTEWNSSIWSHIAMTYGGDTLRAYLNGTETGNNTLTSGDIDYSGDATLFGIGVMNPHSPGFYMKGVLDDVRIYSRALTVAEINAIYQAGN